MFTNVREARQGHWKSSIALSLVPLIQVYHWANRMAVWLDWLVSELSASTCLCSPALGLQAHTAIFCFLRSSWGFELRFSFLCIKCCYLPSHFLRLSGHFIIPLLRSHYRDIGYDLEQQFSDVCCCQLTKWPWPSCPSIGYPCSLGPSGWMDTYT